ncbi:MAG: hypothetical protein WDW36_005532 [Sanguina aurantia]
MQQRTAGSQMQGLPEQSDFLTDNAPLAVGAGSRFKRLSWGGAVTATASGVKGPPTQSAERVHTSPLRHNSSLRPDASPPARTTVVPPPRQVYKSGPGSRSMSASSFQSNQGDSSRPGSAVSVAASHAAGSRHPRASSTAGSLSGERGTPSAASQQQLLQQRQLLQQQQQQQSQQQRVGLTACAGQQQQAHLHQEQFQDPDGFQQQVPGTGTRHLQLKTRLGAAMAESAPHGESHPDEHGIIEQPPGGRGSMAGVGGSGSGSGGQMSGFVMQQAAGAGAGAGQAGNVDATAVRRAVLREVLAELLGEHGPMLDSFRLDVKSVVAVAAQRTAQAADAARKEAAASIASKWQAVASKAVAEAAAKADNGVAAVRGAMDERLHSSQAEMAKLQRELAGHQKESRSLAGKVAQQSRDSKSAAELLQAANERLAEAEKQCAAKTRAAARSSAEAEKLKAALAVLQEAATAAAVLAAAEHEAQLAHVAQALESQQQCSAALDDIVGELAGLRSVQDTGLPAVLMAELATLKETTAAAYDSLHVEFAATKLECYASAQTFGNSCAALAARQRSCTRSLYDVHPRVYELGTRGMTAFFVQADLDRAAYLQLRQGQIKLTDHVTETEAACTALRTSTSALQNRVQQQETRLAVAATATATSTAAAAAARTDVVNLRGQLAVMSVEQRSTAAVVEGQVQRIATADARTEDLEALLMEAQLRQARARRSDRSWRPPRGAKKSRQQGAAPLQPSGREPLVAMLAERYGLANAVQALGTIVLDADGALGAPGAALH